MEWLSSILLILYIVSFSFILHYLSIRKIITIDSRLAIAGFLIRVTIGCVYGFLFSHYFNGDDTWRYHQQSIEETKRFIQDPVVFVRQLFAYEHYIKHFEMTHPWESIQYGFFIKMLALFNILSGGAYYVNVVLFNMIVFWGAYYFYQLFVALFKAEKKWIGFLVFGFFPVVFWTSGIRKDGLLFLAIGFFLYSFYRFLHTKNRMLLFGCLLSIFLMLLNRASMIYTLIPVSMAWWISFHKSNPITWQIVILGIMLILYWMLPFSFTAFLIQKNHAFSLLIGSSRVPLPILDDSFTSIAKALPYAIQNVFLSPLPNQLHNPLILCAGVETIGVILALLLFMCFPKRHLLNGSERSTIVALLTLCLLNYVFIGLIVPFLGAIVRYRSIFEWILFSCFILGTDWIKLKRYILK